MSDVVSKLTTFVCLPVYSVSYDFTDQLILGHSMTDFMYICFFFTQGFWATSKHSPFYRSSTGKPIGNVTISVPIDEKYVYIDTVNELRRHKSSKMNFICEQSAGTSTCINESTVWVWNFEKRFSNVIRKLMLIITRIYMRI